LGAVGGEEAIDGLLSILGNEMRYWKDRERQNIKNEDKKALTHFEPKILVRRLITSYRNVGEEASKEARNILNCLDKEKVKESLINVFNFDNNSYARQAAMFTLSAKDFCSPEWGDELIDSLKGNIYAGNWCIDNLYDALNSMNWLCTDKAVPNLKYLSTSSLAKVRDKACLILEELGHASRPNGFREPGHSICSMCSGELFTYSEYEKSLSQHGLELGKDISGEDVVRVKGFTGNPRQMDMILPNISQTGKVMGVTHVERFFVKNVL
jgi:hypothetical protein